MASQKTRIASEARIIYVCVFGFYGFGALAFRVYRVGMIKVVEFEHLG